MEKYYESTLSLPLYSDLTQENVAYVGSTLKEILVSARVEASHHVFKGKRGKSRSGPNQKF